ncbi:hypothetical protein [Neptunicella sp. SCSIO 80796]|uniref:hypothetical protein n=1 Tax=Neptunicella plasticusilytica TaxID=3117012 RepID=UPI003A4DF4E9
MKLTRCPVCHHHLHLESLIQDQAGKELLALVAKLPTQTASSLLSYLGLFRPVKSDLNNGRALRLLHDILNITPNHTALCQAIDQTVNQISASRQQGGEQKPLVNHNYMKKVLCNIPGWNSIGAINNEISQSAQSSGKAGVSNALLNVHDSDWAN